MAATTTLLRRSKRLTATNTQPPASGAVTKPSQRKKIASASSNQSKRSTSPPRSLRSTSASTRSASIDLDALDAHLAQHHHSSLPTRQKPQSKRPAQISLSDSPSPSPSPTASITSSSASASSDYTDDSTSCTSYTSFTSYTDSSSAFQWAAGRIVGTTARNASYDSRCEDGNEEYEMDGFVVGEGDDEIEVGEWGDAETVVGDSAYAYEDEEDEGVYDDEDEYDREFCDGRAEHGSDDEARRESLQSRSSGSSGLFCSDADDAAASLALALSVAPYERSRAEGEGPLITEVSEELVEEIGDAVALFGRRCNRGRKPVGFWLSADVVADEEVREVLERAMRIGVGRCVAVGDGTVRWWVGPKGG